MAKVEFEYTEPTTLDLIYWELATVQWAIEDRAQQMADEANRALDDLVELMTVRADYEHLRFMVLNIMPLGIQTFVDKRLVEILAKSEGLDHIADALIDELSLKGAGIALALRD